jgi:hypothetical protein
MTISGKSFRWICPACPQMIITNGQQQSSLYIIYIAIYSQMSRKKPIYGTFQYFRATLRQDASENNHLWREPIDEISENNAIWLYHANFMLIIGLKFIFPGYYIDFLDANANSAFF